MRKQSKLAVLVLGALAVFGGCKKDSTEYAYKEGKVNGYNAMINVDQTGRRITLLASGKNDPSRLHAVDYENDGRFDEIFIRDLPKGHALEKYVALDELEQAYKSIKQEQ